MKCIAIDDEPMALNIIAQFCKRMGDMELSTYTNPLVGWEQVKRTRPDIVFLDIEMGGVNGVEMARELPAGVFLIFTTAYAQFAVDGFELNAVDFLHKPFSYMRFEKAVQKAVRLRSLLNMAETPVMNEEEITVKVEYKNVKIKLSTILYIEAVNNYVRFHIVDARPILSQMSMKSIMDLLPADKFIRVHKSFIVPRHRIASYSRTQVVLYNQDITIPVGRAYADALREQ